MNLPHAQEAGLSSSDLFGLPWSDAEKAAIREISHAKEMPPFLVLKAALRLYQAHHVGGCQIVWPNPKAEGRGSNATTNTTNP